MSHKGESTAGLSIQGQRAALLDVQLVKQLLIRPAPQTQEHAYGHWLRIAHRNGLSDPRWLLDRPAPRCMGIVRVCPTCLAQPDAWWPGAWSDRERPWCEVHNQWLVDTCTGCHQPLRWHGVQLLRCRCGQALGELPAPALTPECRQALITERIAPLSVLVWLGALVKHGLSDKPMKKAARQGMSDVIDLVEQGADLVNNWPGAFFRALDACRVHAPGQDSLQLLNLTLPGLSQRIRKLGHAHWRVRIQNALDAYAAASRQTRSPVIGRNVEAHEVGSGSVASVAKALGVRTERLKLALDNLAGEQVKTRRTANGRSRRLMTPAVIQQVQFYLEDRITTKEAARLLDLSAARVEQLVSAKHLVRQAGRLSKLACNTLRQSVMQVCVRKEIPSDAIPISEALRFWIPVARSSEFFRAVLSRELAAYAQAHSDSIQTVLIGRERVMSWAVARSDLQCEWLSVPDCAKRLGLKQQVAYHLMRVGLLPTQKAVVNRRVAQVVTLKALEQFEHRYEPLTKAACRAGVNPRHGVAWACANGIKFVSGPLVDGGRQYFVRVRA